MKLSGTLVTALACELRLLPDAAIVAQRIIEGGHGRGRALAS